MMIGIVKELKDSEYRVALTPTGAEVLIQAGHQLLVESGAGFGISIPDNEYVNVGAQIVATNVEVWQRADMVYKVKEPISQEYDLMREGLLLFTFLHLAANEELAHNLLERKVTAVGYETIELADGSLPLLAPMSEIAGRLAVQVAAHYLEKPQGGPGKLLGGVPGVHPCSVVILGAGHVGANAAQVAVGMGACVTVIDNRVDRLSY